MKEDFVSFEIAKKLKDNGFKENCLYNYRNNGCLMPNYVHPINGDFVSDGAYGCCNDLFTDYTCDAPTISQVLKWLREEKSLHVEIVSAAYGYIYIVSDTPNKGGTDRVNSRYRGRNDGGAWDDYNECVLDAIEYVIDNLI